MSMYMYIYIYICVCVDISIYLSIYLFVSSPGAAVWQPGGTPLSNGLAAVAFPELAAVAFPCILVCSILSYVLTILSICSTHLLL